MATRLHFARINKELAFSRVFTQAKNQSLVAVATIGNTSSADKYKVRYDLEGVGATVNLSRNTLKAKGLEMLGDELLPIREHFLDKWRRKDASSADRWGRALSTSSVSSASPM